MAAALGSATRLEERSRDDQVLHLHLHYAGRVPFLGRLAAGGVWALYPCMPSLLGGEDLANGLDLPDKIDV